MCPLATKTFVFCDDGGGGGSGGLVTGGGVVVGGGSVVTGGDVDGGVGVPGGFLRVAFDCHCQENCSLPILQTAYFRRSFDSKV